MKSTLRASIVRQFGHPTGWVGHLAGQIMAHRPSNRVRNRESIRFLEIAPEHRVLELGFGPGLAIQQAARLAHRGRVVGVDHSFEMLRLAQRRNARAIRRGIVQLLHGSVDDLPPNCGGFDRVLAVNVFMFWEEPVAVLQRLRSIMRDEARIAITFQARTRGATSADSADGARKIAQALEEAGFASVCTHAIAVEPRAFCVLGATFPSLSR